MRVSYTCHINGIGVCMAKGPPRHPPPKPANAKAARALVHLRARRGSRPTPSATHVPMHMLNPPHRSLIHSSSSQPNLSPVQPAASCTCTTH
jgi:hypothetical protein